MVVTIAAATAIFFSIPFSQQKYDYNQTLTSKLSNSINNSELIKQPDIVNLDEDPSSKSLMENIHEKSFVNNSTQIYPDTKNTYYGSNELPSISNPRTSYGVVSTTLYNDGIKLISNSGIILWEQYIADHPVFSSLSLRFSMDVASATIAEDQNALIVLTKVNNNGNLLFYLIAYDLATGLPIYDKTSTNPVTVLVNESGLSNNHTQEMSIVYNPISQLVVCYTRGLVSQIKSQLASFYFDVTNLQRPFNKRTQTSYFNWTLGSAPNNVSNNDYLIDVSVDNQTGLFFGTFQRSSGGNQNEKMYIIPFNEKFSTIRRARGAFIPISENLGDPTNFAPNYVYRKNKEDLSKGMIYGIYHHKVSSQHKIYRYAIEVDTSDTTSPFITTNISSVNEGTFNGNIGIKIDENQNNIGYAVNNNKSLSAKVFNYDFLSSSVYSVNSPSSWENNNFNFTLTNEEFDSNNLKFVVSKVGYFEQWTKASNADSTTKFTPIPLINLNYRSQFLGYSNSGSSKYPTQITDEILQSCSEQLYTPNTEQLPINGEGLWGLFRAADSFSIQRDNFRVSNVERNDATGVITFDISIPYVINSNTYTNTIKKISLIGLKTIKSQTSLNVKSLDINRYNSVDYINQDGIPFREKRPDLTNMSAEEMKLIIVSLLVNKPYDIKPENVIIDEETIRSDYLKGTLTIPKISLNYYYDKYGVLQKGNIDIATNFVLEGFYQASQTFIDTEATYYAPRYTTANEFISNSEIHNLYLYNLITNVPIEFDFNKDLEFEKTIGDNIIIDNKTGTLTINELFLLKWNDENGALHKTRSSPYKIVIHNFVNSTGATDIRDEYLVYRPDIQPTEISMEEILTIIKQITLNIPQKFDVSNISFSSDPIFNNLNGTITLKPVFNMWYDENGFIQTTPKEMGTVVLKGYKAVQPTTFNESWNIGFYNKYASDFIKEEDYLSLKKIIVANINNLPFFHENSDKNFDYKNDIILEPRSVNPNNTNGSITFNLKLRKYYDQSGVYHDDDLFPFQEITITGFKRIFGPTSFEAIYNIGLTDISPQDFTDAKIKEFLLSSGYNLPVDLSSKNISFVSVQRVPIEGAIKVIPILNKYYDEQGNPQEDNKTFPLVTIKGFKQINPTSFDENRWILGTANLVAEEVANNTPLLKEFLMRKIVNAPDTFTHDNIELLNEPFSNNSQGTINVRVRLTKYYDKYGLLKNDGNSDIFNLTLTGFYQAYSKTNIQTSINLNYPDTIPQEINTIKLKEILIDNFSSLPPGFRPENIILQSGDWEFHNIEGIIIIPSLKINYYFDQTLKIKKNIYVFPTIKISGFKKIQPTQLPLTDWDIGNSNIVASEFVKDEENIKKMISSRIINKPSSFDYSRDILLTDLRVANELGSFGVSVSLKKYYDNKGKLSTYGWIPQNIVVSGFLIVDGPTSFPSSINSLSPTISPYMLKVGDIQKILFSSISNKPPLLTPSDIIIDINSDVQIDNIKGEITVRPTLNRWFNDNKELQNIPKKFGEIKIYNFRKNNQTVINNFWDYGDANITAEEASKNTSLIKNIIFNNVINKPENFTLDNIIINNIDYDNINGIVIVKFILNKYFDESGTLKTEGFSEYTARITGYRVISSTIIPTTGWTIGDPSKLASDFLNESNHQYIKKLVYSRVLNLPSNYNFNNIVLTNLNSNNLLGILSFNVKVKGGYAIDGSVDLAGNSANLNSHITISGFKTTYATSIKERPKIANVSSFYPEIFKNNIDDLKDIIYKNRYFIFDNLPSSFTKNDIVDIQIKNANNKNGTILIDISLKKYYSSQNGNLIDDSSNLFKTSVLLTGFYSSNNTLFNTGVVNINELGNQLSSEFNVENDNLNTKWLQIIDKYKDLFFKNLPPDFTIDNIQNIRVTEINNVDGTCKITLSMKGYFADNELCSIVESYNDISFKVSGFKTINKTTFNNDVVLSFIDINSISVAANSLLASDLFYKYSRISIDQIIKENLNLFFNFLPTDFNINNVKNIEMKSFDNLLGKLVVNVTIDRYYSENGILTTTPITNTFNITGFKQVSPTIYNKIVTISNLSQIVATDLSKEDIVKIIYENRSIIFNNTLPDCSLNEFIKYFEIIDFNATNFDSTITLKGNLSIYYDESGNLIKDKNSVKNINLTIKGFKQLNNKTSFRQEVWLEKYDNILISNAIVDGTFLPSTIVANKDKVFENIPNDLSLSDIVVRNVAYNNIEGSVSFEIELKKYYDQNGVLITTSSADFTPLTSNITMYGFQRVEPTSIGSTLINSASSSLVLEANIGDAIFTPSHYANIDIIDAQTQLYNLVVSKLFAGSINNEFNDKLIISNFIFKPETASDKNNSLIVSFTINNYITTENGLVTTPTSVLLTITGWGGYKEETVSKDTIYYITIIAVVYLSILSSGVVAYIIYKLLRWRKGRI